MRRVKSILTHGGIFADKNAAVGIGSLIVFIAMLITAGIAASVMMQTMSSLEQQAMKTGQDVMKDISSGITVTNVNGYNGGSSITKLAILITTTAGSDNIDLSQAYVSLSDSSKQVVLNYTNDCFSSNVSNGLFDTLNTSTLTATTYGIMVIRDIDGSCTQTHPTINNEDMVVLLVDTSRCFSGIGTRTEISGRVVPEQGISGMISFTTPSVYITTIVELQ